MKGKKLTPYPKLRKKARTVFAAWIRNRDRKCITCERGGADNAGHYIHRNCFDFHEQLNHGQCVYCNLRLHGNMAVYALKMIDLYGRDQVDEWHRQSHEVIKFTRDFLENVIVKYKI